MCSRKTRMMHRCLHCDVCLHGLCEAAKGIRLLLMLCPVLSDAVNAEACFGCVHSNIRLPTDGELDIFSPGAVQRDGACGRDCMHVGAFDVPHSHKLTTPMMAGGRLVQGICVLQY